MTWNVCLALVLFIYCMHVHVARLSRIYTSLPVALGPCVSKHWPGSMGQCIYNTMFAYFAQTHA